MKITEQNTKSLTFVFNKESEHKAFIEFLKSSIKARNEIPMDQDTHSVTSSIKSHILAYQPLNQETLEEYYKLSPEIEKTGGVRWRGSEMLDIPPRHVAVSMGLIKQTGSAGNPVAFIDHQDTPTTGTMGSENIEITGLKYT